MSGLLRRAPGDGCWEWTAGKLPAGYGVLADNSVRPPRNLYAHRLAYEVARGPIPDGMYVCHRCDNPSCVRPDHLFLGTPRDNTRDALAKGRMKLQSRDPRPCDFPQCGRVRHGRFCRGHEKQMHRLGEGQMRPLNAARSAAIVRGLAVAR